MAGETGATGGTGLTRQRTGKRTQDVSCGCLFTIPGGDGLYKDRHPPTQLPWSPGLSCHGAPNPAAMEPLFPRGPPHAETHNRPSVEGLSALASADQPWVEAGGPPSGHSQVPAPPAPFGILSCFVLQVPCPMAIRVDNAQA